MAIIIDNIHLKNSIKESNRDNIVVLRVTEREIQEAFAEYKTSKFSKHKISKDKHKGHIKRKYQKYHKDIRVYIKRYHQIKSMKHG